MIILLSLFTKLVERPVLYKPITVLNEILPLLSFIYIYLHDYLFALEREGEEFPH